MEPVYSTSDAGAADAVVPPCSCSAAAAAVPATSLLVAPPLLPATAPTAAADPTPCPPEAAQTSVDAAESPLLPAQGAECGAAPCDVGAPRDIDSSDASPPPPPLPQVQQQVDAAPTTLDAPAAVVEGAAAAVGTAEELDEAPAALPADGTGDTTSAPVDGADAQEAAPLPQPTYPAGATPSQRAAVADAQAWVIDFAPTKSKPVRKITKKEKDAIKQSRLRSAQTTSAPQAAAPASGHQRCVSAPAAEGLGVDSEGNAVVSPEATADAGAATDGAAPTALQVVRLDTSAADRDALIPTNLTTTRADLEARLVLRLPRLLCVNKQYPRGCGIASLTSVYNYLYSWLGESAVGADRPPHSQEEIMSILGFEPPFGDIAWGPFTGNATLVRWFHALNRHFGHSGRAYILYKAHGHGKTTHLYPDNAAALAAVKAALRDPHCALIYHCHNHYMVPVGYQDIPLAQSDFLRPTVSEANCDTTVFIGEVSRGRHEAMYARRWSQVVKDIECKSPHFFNIRHPEQGIQRREPKKKDATPHAGSSQHVAGGPAAAEAAEQGVAQSGIAAPVAVADPVVAPEDRAEATAESAEAPEAAPPADDTTSGAQRPGDSQGEVADTPLLTPPEPGAAAAEGSASLPADASDAAVPNPPPPVLPPIAVADDAANADAATPADDAAPFPSVAAAPTEAAARPSAPASPPDKPKKERGNLHCIICFRNDEVEPRLERYEDVPATQPPWMLSSSSSSSREGSSDSDADDGA